MSRLVLAAILILTTWVITPIGSAAETSADTQTKLASLEKDVLAQFSAKDYQRALETCQTMIALAPDSDTPQYNLACAQARLGKTDEAIASLATAIDKGFDDAEHIQRDEDLASLRDDQRFADLKTKARAKKLAKPWEKGADISGVKTVEDLPEGGLRYRVRMSPDATAEKPNKLLVWLHPSGGSMNKVAESMSSFLNVRGFALLVCTSKQWAGWSDEEMDQLMTKTLPAVGKIPGIDATRPILMGFSAGGQAALMVWAADPSKLGGVVVDAAYPIDSASYAAGKPELIKLPTSDALSKVPMFVLVGDQDGGHVFWKKCEDDWRKAGVPLTVEYVAGGQHQWLFGKPQIEAWGTWLIGLAAVQQPAAEKPAEK